MFEPRTIVVLALAFSLSDPKCNHLFIEGVGRCTPAEYARPGHVAKMVIDDMAKWIHQNR